MLSEEPCRPNKDAPITYSASSVQNQIDGLFRAWVIDMIQCIRRSNLVELIASLASACGLMIPSRGPVQLASLPLDRKISLDTGGLNGQKPGR